MTEALRIAVAGTGYFSRFHYDAWARMDDVEVVALASLDAAAAASVAEAHGVPAVYDDVAALLDAQSPDLLDIVTPPPSHLPILREAARRGIDVICQKPLAPTFEEALDLVETAGSAGIMLAVHENFRFMPWFRHAHGLIKSGRLGQLHSVSFRLRPGDGQGPRAYLDRQPYFQDMQRFLIHETGIHFIDTFRFLMGEVAAVTARLRRLNPAIAGEDAGIAVFEFVEGSTGIFDGNRLNDHSAENCRLTMGEMHLEGSEGVLRLDGSGNLWWKPHGKDEVSEAYAWDNVGFGGDCVFALQRHVVDHLAGRAPLENSGRDYLANLRVEEAVYASHEAGRRVLVQAGGL